MSMIRLGYTTDFVSLVTGPHRVGIAAAATKVATISLPNCAYLGERDDHEGPAEEAFVDHSNGQNE